MEPITATLTTAKEIYEAAKTIQKVYNVSKEMKTVAESEGKDQIMATKDFAGTAANLKHEAKSEKGESSNKELKIEEDMLQCQKNESHLPKEDFVDKLESTHVRKENTNDTVDFVEKLPIEGTSKELQNSQDVYIDRLLSSNSSGSSTELGGEVPNALQNESTNEKIEQNPLNTNDATDSTSEKKPEGLTEQEKQEIKDKTGWSDKIVDAIRTKEEAQVYIDAGLVEGEVNGKPALLQPNIDGKACNEPKWPDWSNKDLAEEGYPPRDKNGRPYELHHIGQNPDSPLAELTYEQHHCDGNFKILHTFDESSIDRMQFNKERKEYWSERSKTL